MSGRSNFPNGFAQGVTIRGLPLLQMHPGEVFYVNNSSVLAKGAVNGSNGNDGSYRRPFSTLTYALTKCTADRGDIIALMPGHTETVATAAAAGLTLNVAGVAVVGLGAGTKKPKITQTLADTTIVISADDMSFVNLAFEAGIADVATGLDISAVDGLSFDSCTFSEGATAGTYNYVNFIDIADTARDFSMENCTFIGNDANNDAMIVMVGVVGLRLYGNNFYQNVAQATVVAQLLATDAVVDADIRDCNFRNLKDAAVCINFDQTDNSGIIRDCMFSTIDDADAITGNIDATGINCFECYFAGEVDSWGIIGGGAAIYNNA